MSSWEGLGSKKRASYRERVAALATRKIWAFRMKDVIHQKETNNFSPPKHQQGEGEAKKSYARKPIVNAENSRRRKENRRKGLRRYPLAEI